MNPKRLIVPVIVAAATLLFLVLYLPGLRPDPLAGRVVEGAPAIGGTYTLVDQRGQPFSSDLLKGKYQLVYFGFTNCPDICPLSLQVMTDALNIAGPMAENVVPVFITVDPERDTPQVMAEYVANFHPRFVALTGTPEQVRAATSAYRVYFKKAAEESPGEYMMEHSGFVYLMNGEGAYVTHFKSDATAEQMAARLRQEFGPKR
jgi:protein SCO1/2